MSINRYDLGSTVWRKIGSLYRRNGANWTELKEVWRYDSGTSSWVKIWSSSLPTIQSCSASETSDGGFSDEKVTVYWDTGDDCESVRVDLLDSSDTVVQTADVGTVPNQGGYSHEFTRLIEGQTYYGKVVPFSGDSQTGTEGTACTTNNVTT